MIYGVLALGVGLAPGIAQAMSSVVFAGSAQFIIVKPEEARKLCAACDEAIEIIRAEESAAKAILPKYAPVEPDIAAKTKLYAWWTSSQIDIKSLQSMTDLLERDGILKGHVDVRNIVINANYGR
jgi:ABC-type nitrate/sulfonate/bicarbonate transport system substrate-binding protein